MPRLRLDDLRRHRVELGYLAGSGKMRSVVPPVWALCRSPVLQVVVLSSCFCYSYWEWFASAGAREFGCSASPTCFRR